MLHPFRGRSERWSTESDAAAMMKRNPSIVIEARSSSLSLAESSESNGATAAPRQEKLNSVLLREENAAPEHPAF